MEIYKPEQQPKPEEVMETFYKKFSESGENGVKDFTRTITGIKGKRYNNRKFLDYLCQKMDYCCMVQFMK